MLIGQYQSKISEKGRVAVPSKFRNELGEKPIIAKWYEGCLVIVNSQSWLDLLNKLTGKSEIISSPIRDTDRFILGSAFEVDMDDQGRFVIPKALRDYSDLTNDAIFLGLGTRIEIWNKNQWLEREKYIQKHAAEMVEEISEKNK